VEKLLEKVEVIFSFHFFQNFHSFFFLDYLDSGMNKKAIQEGDRLLKKHSQASPTIQVIQ